MKQHNYKIAIVNCQLSIILMALLFALPLKAQVNIGSLDSPHPFSILELTTTENNHGGLRMPQLDNDERAAAQEKFNETTATAEAAKGLVIYNTDTGCLEFWNGKEWISLCSDILPPLPPTLDVDLGSMTFSSNGNVTSSAMNIVTVTTNQANWTATITYKQGDEWLTGVPASGTNGQQFTVTVPGGATTLRTAIITITAGDLTRYVAVAQFPDNYQDSPVPASIIPYVGAFWKHNQTGERLIWIPRPTTGNVDVADGAWTAAVISGSDWITLDKQMTSDPNVGWLTGADEANVDNGNDNGFDNKHAVANGSNMVTGTMDASIPQIYFRIGLKSALVSGETAPRYGIVLLSYNDNTLSQRIFIRQGEAADYLFRGDDPVGSGSSIASRTAIQCKQYLPYNLTDPNGNSSDALLTSGVPDVGLAPYGGVPVDYPSQAGYFFRWNYSRQAFAPHIVGTITNWDNTLLQSGDGNWVVPTNNETCPPGYRRPNDGPQNNAPGPAVSLIEAACTITHITMRVCSSQ